MLCNAQRLCYTVRLLLNVTCHKLMARWQSRVSWHKGTRPRSSIMIHCAPKQDLFVLTQTYGDIRNSLVSYSS